MEHKTFKERHNGMGAGLFIADLFLGGKIAEGRTLRQERTLTDQLIGQAQADPAMEGLAAAIDGAQRPMTIQQHREFRAGLTQEGDNRKRINSATEQLGEQMVAFSQESKNPDDLAQLDVMKRRLITAQKFSESMDPAIRALGISELGKVSGDLQSFSTTNEAQRLADDARREQVGNETWSRFSGLRDDYRTDSADFKQRQSAWNTMKVSSFHPDHAGDVARVNAFMHMVEPGSIVMPGEAANVAGLAGVSPMLVTAISKLYNEGGTFTPKQREELHVFASEIMTKANIEQADLNDRYAGQAGSGNVPAEWMQDLLLPSADTAFSGQEDFGTLPGANVADETDSTATMVGQSTMAGVKSLLGGALDATIGAFGAILPPKRPPPTPTPRFPVRGTIQRPTDEYPTP